MSKKMDWFLKSIFFISLLIISSNAKSLRKSNDTQKNLFPLSVIHINDFHDRFEEMNILTGECKYFEGDPCIGGYARIVAVVKKLQQTRSNPIYFNAGDNFVGTLWFMIGGWNMTAHFLNMLKADVMTIGNHELDNGPNQLVPFLDAIQSPLVLANVDLSEEPELQGKFLNSTIITRSGRKIGIIGLIKSDIFTIAQTGKIKFLDEIETARGEAEKLKNDGVNIIVVLSHAGIDVDFEIAKKAGPNVDIIVSSHTHTFMYTGDNPPGPDKPEYDYPAVVEQENGHKVLIVQASAFAKYVGDLTVYFDESGEPKRWIGQPIFLGADIEPDELILNEMKPWKKEFEKYRQVFGESAIALDKSKCQYVECGLGDLITHAFLSNYHKHNNYTKTAVAFMAAGGIRGSLVRGTITFDDVFSILPFGNTVDSFDLLGQYIWDAMEYSARAMTNHHLEVLTQISGMRIEVNVTEPEGSRVKSIQILCEECSPVLYEPIDVNHLYRVIADKYLAAGGDGFTMFPENSQNYKTGDRDTDVLSSHIKEIKRLESVEGTGRIIVVS